MYRNFLSSSPLRLGTVLVILAVLASAAVMVFTLHSEADNSSAEIVEYGVCGPDTYYKYFSDGTLEISGYGWTYNYSGTIRSPWFDYRTDITRIVIGDHVTDLGAWTFVGCKNVTELTMPITLHTVGSDLSPAFAGCYRIERINFTYGTDGHGPGYDAYPVNDCWYQNTPWYESRDSLRELNFEEGIIGIGSDTFRELNITSLVLPNTLSIVGDHCFFNCTKLTELTYPISLRPFCNEDYPSFQGCMAIEKVTFTHGNGIPYDYWTPESVPGDTTRFAPWNMNFSIAKTIIISDDIPRYGVHMFYCCNVKDYTCPISIMYPYCSAPHSDNLEKVTITKGAGASGDFMADTICYLPWYKSPNVKTIIVEEGVTRIGDYMFYKCHTENLILPNTLNSLGDSAFKSTEIKNLTVPITLNTVYSEKRPAFEYVSGIETVTLTPGDSGYGFDYAPNENSNCYFQLTPWYQCRSTLKEIVFEDGILGIGSEAFRELNIISVTIPDSVRTLGNHTFYRCDNLGNLTIPITLDTVCSNTYPAFDQCNAIMNLRLTAGENGIGWDYSEDQLPIWCTSGCWLSKLSVDDDVSYVGSNTFSGYLFFSLSGSTLSPTAENLSGYTYTGSAGILNMNWQPADDLRVDPMSNSIAGLNSVNFTDLALAIGFSLLMAVIAVLVGALIRKDTE